MNEQLLLYFRPKKVDGLTMCFNCGEVNENVQYFADLFRCYIQKEKSSICYNAKELISSGIYKPTKRSEKVKEKTRRKEKLTLQEVEEILNRY